MSVAWDSALFQMWSFSQPGTSGVSEQALRSFKSLSRERCLRLCRQCSHVSPDKAELCKKEPEGAFHWLARLLHPDLLGDEGSRTD